MLGICSSSSDLRDCGRGSDFRAGFPRSRAADGGWRDDGVVWVDCAAVVAAAISGGDDAERGASARAEPIAIPFVSGFALALFLAVCMSVTAFPVLARILDETGLQKARLGAVAIAWAAFGDVIAWLLLAAILAFSSALTTLGLPGAYVAAMLVIRWVWKKPDRRARLPFQRSLLAYVGVGFDFDQHVGVDQFADFDHGGGGHDSFEELAVGAAGFFPARDVGDEHSCADDVFERCSGFFESGLDVADRLHGLGVHVAFADDLAVGAGGGGAGHVDVPAYADGARIAYDGFPLCSGGDVEPGHKTLSHAKTQRRQVTYEVRSC